MVHDYGLAPNPFGQYCTLAVCAGKIRRNKNLSAGDWVLGFGGKTIRKPKCLIYAMKVKEIISFQDYWHDERFQYKKPVFNGSLIQQYGDNFYHYDPQIIDPKEEDWIQEPSAHSTNKNTPNLNHLGRDIRGENVLIAQQGAFYYWGQNAIELPTQFQYICPTKRSMVYKDISIEEKTNFIDWLINNHEPGILGYPINWKEEHGVNDNFLNYNEES
jgi:hypothetical protein